MVPKSLTAVRRDASSRPRVEGDREDEILEATIALLVETGFERLTMDAVAKRAKASKATLYRRWNTKNELVVDALVRAKATNHAPVQVDSGSLREDLIGTFCGSGGFASQSTRVLGAVMTTLLTDPEFAEIFRERFLASKIATTETIYARAIARGEVAPDADLETIAPALAGILLHRYFVLGQPVTRDVVARVVDHVILPAVHHSPKEIR